MEKLPWFIKHEILDYLISLQPECCLLNKETFQLKAGPLMKLNVRNLTNQQVISDRFKRAELLHFYPVSGINYDYLQECKSVKKVVFHILPEMLISKRFISFLNETPVELMGFKFENEEGTTFSINILKLIYHKLKYLYLKNNDDTEYFSKLFELSFPQLIALGTKDCLGAVNFSQFFLAMPNLESLIINVDRIYFKVNMSDKVVFDQLKVLSINIKDRKENNIEPLLRFSFPNLKTFQLEGRCGEFNDKLVQNMPKLQVLSIKLNTCSLKTYGFPKVPFPHLKELLLYFWPETNYHVFNIGLKKMPRLQKLQLNGSLVFSEPQIDIFTKITHLEFNVTETFPYHIVNEHFPFLTTLIMDCSKAGKSIHDILKLCDRVINLTLRGLKWYTLSSNLLPSGPFKTTHLRLRGGDFITEDLVNWLATQFHLTHLDVLYSDHQHCHIDLSKFSHLKHVSI